ncbi:DUF551 domain-containing protein [Salmonella enterica]|nr:DUF551 domain-containing protein [Salmonella enterica]ECJ5878462.1 DUF551 domain-containing protein [Salmonella enterica subsp. houtenae]EGW0967549.1 DUF551 domain-containing protein [Salmonella enterica]EJA0608523.1 DUF551 domain-containing protein [Salmonella enterica]EJL7596377.1 DUF551 domain-containing protein [Salmonella enterica]
MTTITNNKLTDERVSNATLIRLIQWAEQHNSHYVAAALRELQERRKADSAEPAGYHVIKECGKVGCSVATLEEAEKTRDFWNKKWIIRPYFYSAAPAPVVPEKMNFSTACNFVQINGMAKEDRATLAMRAWNACRTAMLQGAEPVSQTYKLNELSGNSPVTPDGWISCSEQMPDEIGRYWCYVEEQNDLGKSHYQWNCSWNGDKWGSEMMSGKVTHWMPLPEPPQEFNRG